MGFVVKRRETAPRRAPWAVAAGSAVLVAGSVMAAPGLGLSGLPGIARDSYAVRFVLPRSHPPSPPAAIPTAREAPLAEIAAPAANEEEDAPKVEASPVAIAAVTSLPVPTVARTPRSKVPGVIALNYSLAGGATASDSIEVEKSVTFRGADAGRIPLRIDGNAKVFALRSRLAAIIAAQSGDAAVPEGLEKDFVSLEALRALGIGVRYDAIRDRLVLDPPAA